MAEDHPETSTLHVTDIPVRDISSRPQLVETPQGRLALVLAGEGDDARPIAIDAWCPHLDGPLWEGGVSGDEIACPWHGWRYSLRTGACTWAPRGDAEEAAETEIRVLGVREGDGGVAVIVLGEE